MNTPEKTPEKVSSPPSEPLAGLLKDAVRAVRQSAPPPGFGAKLLAEAATWKHPVSSKPIAPPASRNPLIMLITASIAASLFFIWFTGETNKRDLSKAYAPEVQTESRSQVQYDREHFSLQKPDEGNFGANQATSLGMKHDDNLSERLNDEMKRLEDSPKSRINAKDTIEDSTTLRSKEDLRPTLGLRMSKERALDASAAPRPGATGDGTTGSPKAVAPSADSQLADNKLMRDHRKESQLNESENAENIARRNMTRENGARESSDKENSAKESKAMASDGAENKFKESNAKEKNDPAKLEAIAESEPKADFDHAKLNMNQPEAKQEASNAPGAAPMGRSRTEAGGVAGSMGGRGFGGGGDPGSAPTLEKTPATAKKKAQTETELHEASDAPIDKMATPTAAPPPGGVPSGGPSTGSPAPGGPGRGGSGGKAAELAMNRKPGDATAPVIRSTTPASTVPGVMPPPGPIGAGAKLVTDPMDRASGADQSPRFAIADKATMFFSILSAKSTELGKPADLSGANLLQGWNWSERESILLGDIAADPIAASPDGKKVYSANGTLFDVELKELKQYRELGESVRALTVSPDGKHLLTQHVDKDFKCYFRIAELANLEKDGAEKETEKIAEKAAEKLAEQRIDITNQWGYTFAAGFSPDNMALALMDKEKIVHEYRLTDGVLLKTYAPAHLNSIRAIEYSPNGKLLASTGTRGETYLWNRETTKLEHELKITQTTPESAAHGLYSMKFSPDSKFLAASGTSNIFFWDTATGEVAAQLEEGSGKAIYLRYSQDGKKLTAITNLTRAKAGEGKEETKSPTIKEWNVPEKAR